jgi:hypothetical protein
VFGIIVGAMVGTIPTLGVSINIYILCLNNVQNYRGNIAKTFSLFA